MPISISAQTLNLQPTDNNSRPPPVLPNAYLTHHRATYIPRGYENRTHLLSNIMGLALRHEQMLIIREGSEEDKNLTAFSNYARLNGIENAICENTNPYVFEGALKCIQLKLLKTTLETTPDFIEDWSVHLVENLPYQRITDGSFPLKERLTALQAVGCNLNDAALYCLEVENMPFLHVLLNMGIGAFMKDSKLNNCLHLLCLYAHSYSLNTFMDHVISMLNKNINLLIEENINKQIPLWSIADKYPDFKTSFLNKLNSMVMNTASPTESQTAHLIMGSLHKFGLFLKQCNESAFIHFRHAAPNHRNTQACYLLGLTYLKGEGVQQNPKTGKQLIHKASSYGFPLACWHDATLLMASTSRAQEHQNEIEKHLSTAIASGIPQAYYALGCIKLHSTNMAEKEQADLYFALGSKYSDQDCHAMLGIIETEKAFNLYRTNPIQADAHTDTAFTHLRRAFLQNNQLAYQILESGFMLAKKESDDEAFNRYVYQTIAARSDSPEHRYKANLLLLKQLNDQDESPLKYIEQIFRSVINLEISLACPHLDKQQEAARVVLGAMNAREKRGETNAQNSIGLFGDYGPQRSKTCIQEIANGIEQKTEPEANYIALEGAFLISVVSNYNSKLNTQTFEAVNDLMNKEWATLIQKKSFVTQLNTMSAFEYIETQVDHPFYFGKMTNLVTSQQVNQDVWLFIQRQPNIELKERLTQSYIKQLELIAQEKPDPLKTSHLIIDSLRKLIF